MKFLPLLPLLAAGFLAVGCASTKFYSQMNNNSPDVKYQRILVQFGNSQQDYSAFGEKATQDEIAKTFGPDIHCYLYSQEFYTGLKSAQEMKSELVQFIQEHNIDAVLVCLSAQDLKRQNKMTYTGTMWMNTNDDQKESKYRMELIDVRIHKSIWYSTATSEGSTYFNSYEGLMKNFIHKSVTDMKSHDLLGPNHQLMPAVAPANPKSSI
jgi:uncharacterized UPF0146 family protein